ncbi:MAG: internalin [Flavobacteriaceae bacterium]|nr:internalin [Flavobacteriaceae bacterium]|tara:strand:+ start:10145 stop:12886 length:2742 start_codon:yes stop_codon:yes gene_type:complete
MKKVVFLLVVTCFINISFSQNVNIPDTNFKNALLNHDPVIDINGDGEIQVSEAEIAIEISVNGQGINTLDGIEYFLNLEELSCGNNNINVMDISQNTNLTYIYCPFNNLSQLDIGSNIMLEALYASDNLMSSIDISNNLSIEYLDMSFNSLSELDLSNNNYLNDLSISNNNIESININNLSQLEVLGVSYNPIINLDFTQNLSLKNLYVSGIPLGVLDVSQLTSLEVLSCSNTGITNLNIVNNQLLKSLSCADNPLTSVDLSNNPFLEVVRLDNTQLSNIDLSSNTLLERLYVNDNELQNLDVSNNPNLKTLSCGNNNLYDLDVSNNPNILALYCYENNLTSLDVSSLNNLYSLQCYINNILDLDLSNNTELFQLYCQYNQLTNLDLSQNTQLASLLCNNNNLQSLNIKNGAIQGSPTFFDNDNLQFICVDESELLMIEGKLNEYGYNSTALNSYCTFTPGGEYYTIEGESRVDANTNGCDVGDNYYPSIKLELTDGTNNGTYLADTSGSYSVPVLDGVHTILPVLENPDYFTVSPNSLTITFPEAGDPYIQDFCLSPNGVHNDVEVILVPTSRAIPGFDSYYKIIYRNKGTTTSNGTIGFDFEDDFMDFLSATPTEDINAIGNLQWNYTDLQPFETREIEVVFNLNTPTDSNFPLNSGDVLSFNASINPVNSDETPDDNEFFLDQVVVNSLDPNDITCLEGETITPEHVGEYVHYRIRFENLGAANATNVVVKDVIDTTKFDVSSLIPLHASHNYTTRIREGNIVEFIFEGINLPFDDANNDGYLVFKIKTLETLQLGDTFTNQAEIYFDFNFPVITNMYSTSVQENLSVNDFELNDVVLFPNPVNNQLYIKSKLNIDTIKIFDINGRLIQNKTMNDSNVQNEVSVLALKSGVYFIEVYSNGQKEVLRFIKK